MSRPLVATIDLAAMQSNLEVARRQAPAARVCAVVKANAYGHGLRHAVQAFAKADSLGLVEPEAAVALRQMGWTKPILLLEGFFDQADLDIVNAHQLDVVIHCPEQIELLARAKVDRPLNIYLKMNTGMNRLGFRPDVFRLTYQRLRALPAVGDIHFMTHFANAEESGQGPLPLRQQVACFQAATEGLAGLRSLANSATDLLHPELAADWVRPGIMLYGASPGGGSAVGFGLRPAMTLTSQVIGVQTVHAGEAVGYGSVFLAEHTMQIGIVACGYADGYPRHAPTGTPVLVNGRRTRLVGRVSMDMLAVDLSALPEAGHGSAVTLWGQGLPIDEVAAAAGTIGYELMCALSARVPVVAS